MTNRSEANRVSDDLVERVAQEMRDAAVLWLYENPSLRPENVPYELLARAAIAVVLEQAAKVADGWVGCPEWSADTNSGYECASREIAAAIRALVKHD